MKDLITKSLLEAQDALSLFISNERNIDDIGRAAEIMAASIGNGNKILSCGNGGSLCDATHFAEELTGRYRKNRRSLPAIAINDHAYLTCAANDFSFDEIFARYVEGVGLSGDVLLAISTSGSSCNVVSAAKVAIEKGMKVVALTSEGDNELSKIAHVSIKAPRTPFSDRIQEIHIKVIHILVQAIEQLTVYNK